MRPLRLNFAFFAVKPSTRVVTELLRARKTTIFLVVILSIPMVPKIRIVIFRSSFFLGFKFGSTFYNGFGIFLILK